MPYPDLIALVEKLYGPALSLERLCARERRRGWRRLLWVGFALSALLALVAFGVGVSALSTYVPLLRHLALVAHKLYAFTLAIFVALFVLSALEAFYRSHYFRGLRQRVPEPPARESAVRVSYEVATVVADTPQHDVTGGFMRSSIGQEVLFRAGVLPEEYRAFVEREDRTRIAADSFFVERDHGVTLRSYAASLLKQDGAFAQWLASAQVRADELVEAAGWVEELEQREQALERWWSRDMLGRIPSIGRTWAYGETYHLDRVALDATHDPQWRDAVALSEEEQNEVDHMEQILARRHEANVLLVGLDEKRMHVRVLELAHLIREGKALPVLEGKRVLLLDLALVESKHTEPATFEVEVRNLLNEALRAGHVLLVLMDFPGAYERARALGIDLVELIAPYLESSGMQFVLLARSEAFERLFEGNSRLMQAVEVVRMRDIDRATLLTVLKERARLLEHVYGQGFTYPALVAAADLSERHFSDGVHADKALDLLEQAAASVGADAEGVYRTDIERLVTRATGVPTGEVTEDERTLLLHLEEHMHERIVGQERAVEAVAKALRRARADTRTQHRAMGSFLFLGPTGVGKTEVAKALAHILFGDEARLLRFDMAEFSGPDAFETFIGSSGTPGRLPVLLRERPYGVLLLDELEKSDARIHDLLLAALDEGQFTDGRGIRVSVKDMLIIATSNAGSDRVWDWAHEDTGIERHTRELMDLLIERGAYRPELLNRFDEVVLFHPLSPTHVEQVARLELAKLAERLKEQGITFVVTDELVRAVAQGGYDAQFGARPLRRFITDHVEQVIADRKLAGTLVPGATIALREEDVRG